MTDTAPTRPLDGDRLLTGDAKAGAVQSMFDAIAPRYDLMNRLLTFRMDVGWRRAAVALLGLPQASTVLDLACGTGDMCRDLQRGGMHAIGGDLSIGMLKAGRTTAQLAQVDALGLPIVGGSVDGVTCGFALRNFVDLATFFAELGRVVRPGGRIALLDVSIPANPLMRLGHSVYFGKVVPLIGGLLSDKEAYRYLPKSVAYLPPTDEIVAMIERAGFDDVQHRLLTFGIAQLFTATRAG